MAAFALPEEQERLYTPEEYLELERVAKFKSEYLHGRIIAMAGGSPRHGAVTANVTAALVNAVDDRPCQAYSSDVRVRANPTGMYSYPDLSIVCGEPEFHDEKQDVIINPMLVVEVLSPTTADFDRGTKFLQYQHLKSLTDYLLVAQTEPRIDHYARHSDDEWVLTIARGHEGRLEIGSLGCTLLLSRVYRNIRFDTVETA